LATGEVKKMPCTGCTNKYGTGYVAPYQLGGLGAVTQQDVAAVLATYNEAFRVAAANPGRMPGYLKEDLLRESDEYGDWMRANQGSWPEYEYGRYKDSAEFYLETARQATFRPSLSLIDMVGMTTLAVIFVAGAAGTWIVYKLSK
jgi:hypothetical protein